MARLAVLVYGVLCYVMFLGVFLYLAAWVGNLVPQAIDSEPIVPLGQALLVNLALLTIFGVQHTVMARPTFKKWWTQFVPRPAERSTYVLFTNIALILMFVFWQPMGGVIWDVQNPVGRGILWAGFATGWLIVLLATFMINHFDLFGLRQVWLHYTGREYTHLEFRTFGFYKHVRHPLYVGWMTAFWFTPTMTAAHLVFAIATTVYIMIALYFEERNLNEFLPEYAGYSKRTPRFIPAPWRKASVEAAPPPSAEPMATTVARIDPTGGAG